MTTPEFRLEIQSMEKPQLTYRQIGKKCIVVDWKRGIAAYGDDEMVKGFHTVLTPEIVETLPLREL